MLPRKISSISMKNTFFITILLLAVGYSISSPHDNHGEAANDFRIKGSTSKGTNELKQRLLRKNRKTNGKKKKKLPKEHKTIKAKDQNTAEQDLDEGPYYSPDGGEILEIQFFPSLPVVCSVDADCESGYFCCPSSNPLGRDKCEACCSSRDCKDKITEQPPAGEWGKPFCRDNQCEAFHDGKSSRIDNNAFKTWYTSETKGNGKEYHEKIVPRIMHSEDPGNPAFEHVWYIDLNEQEESFDKDAVKYNGTHITLPSVSVIHAGYAKSYHSYDEHETGICTFITSPNEYSTVSDYPKGFFVEKLHTLTYNGKIDTSRGDHIKKLSDEGMKEPFSKISWLTRAIPQFLSLLKNKIVTNAVQAGLDRALLWQIRRFANSYPEEDIGSLNPSTVQSGASLAENAKAAIGLAKDVDFERELKKSELHCKHFEGIDGFDATADGVTFPLGKPIMTISGEMVTSPVYYFGLNGGITIASYDEENNVLQIFLQGYNQSRQYQDPMFPGPYPTALFVSPIAEGKDYYVDPNVDGRSDDVYNSEKPSDFFLGNLEPDFTFWARPRSETCDPNDDDSDVWERINVPKGDEGIYEALKNNVDLMRAAVTLAPCANILNRNDYGRGTNGFGVAEFGVWVHALAEIPDYATKAATSAKFWDNWDCFYKNKDPALCSAD